MFGTLYAFKPGHAKGAIISQMLIVYAQINLRIIEAWSEYEMGGVMRKFTFCICENKDADQLRGNREADQGLCFRYTDSTIPVHAKSEISSL